MVTKEILLIYWLKQWFDTKLRAIDWVTSKENKDWPFENRLTYFIGYKRNWKNEVPLLNFRYKYLSAEFRHQRRLESHIGFIYSRSVVWKSNQDELFPWMYRYRKIGKKGHARICHSCDPQKITDVYGEKYQWSKLALTIYDRNSQTSHEMWVCPWAFCFYGQVLTWV